jgi:hypothetical protein
LLQNEFCERQISRVSDFEIKIVAWEKENFATKSLDRGNFIRHGNFLCIDIAISFLDPRAFKDLWRLHCVKLMSIDRIDDHKICIGALERVANWLSQGRGTMHLAPLKNVLDLLRSDQRARGVVDSNIASIRAKISQTSTNGILSTLAASDNGPNFFEALTARELSDLIASIASRDDDYFADAIG